MNNMSAAEAEELCRATQSCHFVKDKFIPVNLINEALNHCAASKELSGIYLFNLGKISAHIEMARKSRDYTSPIDNMEDIGQIIVQTPAEELEDRITELMLNLDELSFRQGYYAALKYEIG